MILLDFFMLVLGSWILRICFTGDEEKRNRKLIIIMHACVLLPVMLFVLILFLVNHLLSVLERVRI